MVKAFDSLFPGLARGDWRVTSSVDKRYNCIAYAAGDTARWWWPLPDDIREVYWPDGVSREETILAFRDAFATIGFSECSDAEFEGGIEKIALFANEHAFPLHAARQLANGRWTSKLGELEDIEHALHDLEGQVYGKVTLIMRRPIVGS